MPSSPEVAAPTVQAWQPGDFASAPPPPPAAHRPQPFSAPQQFGAQQFATQSVEDAVAERFALFELSTTAGIPAAILEPARKAAEAAGYAAGWAVGTREAQREAERDRQAWLEHVTAEADAGRARIASALTALTRAAQTAAERNTPALAEIEHLIVDAAFDIAEAVVHSSLGADPNRGRHAVTRALAMIPQGSTVTVSIHPVDHAVLDSADLGPGVTLLADPTLAPGDAIAVTDVTTVDARISAGLDRVRAMLGGGA